MVVGRPSPPHRHEHVRVYCTLSSATRPESGDASRVMRHQEQSRRPSGGCERVMRGAGGRPVRERSSVRGWATLRSDNHERRSGCAQRQSESAVVRCERGDSSDRSCGMVMGGGEQSGLSATREGASSAKCTEVIIVERCIASVRPMVAR